MAADQRKRRVNAASIIECRSGQQAKARRKKVKLPDHDLKMRSHITLEWDGNQKKVVPKKEQISIKWRDLASFIDRVPRCDNALADVCEIPSEILELDNLSEVLSCEVWQRYLSEDERNSLIQFLPKEQELQQTVQSLLEGANFQFGNPFFNWSSLLCSGSLHPDVVLHQEQHLKANKKVYYSDLQNYHKSMIGKLQKWKDRWASCKDSEENFIQVLQRSGTRANENDSLHRSESRFQDPEENLPVTSESCSWGADEKACSSENQTLMKGAGHQKRKGVPEEKSSRNIATPRKGEKLQKRSEAIKYMSYIKISKKQHQLVKSIKQSGSSIQPRSLNRVLGNLDCFPVQPYEKFEEEEWKKLHNHWLHLANVDLPAAFANWRKAQIQGQLMMKALVEELEAKPKLSVEAGLEDPYTMLQAEQTSEAEEFETVNADDNESIHSKGSEFVPSTGDEFVSTAGGEFVPSTHDEIVPSVRDEFVPSMGDEFVPSTKGEFVPSAGNEFVRFSREAFVPSIAKEFVPSIANEFVTSMANGFIPSTEDEPSQQIPPFKDSHFNCRDTDSEGSHLVHKQETLDVLECSRNLSPTTVSGTHGLSLSSSEDVWPAVSAPDSYIANTRQEYAPTRKLSLGHSRVIEEQQSCFLDLESAMNEEEMEKTMLHRQSDEVSLCPYFNHGQDELLQSFFKGRDVVPYHHQQRELGSSFQATANMLMESNHFPGQFREQPQVPLAFGQMHNRQTEPLVHQNVQQNMFPDGGRYMMPRQEDMSLVNVQDWALNPVRMSGPPQAHTIGGQSLSHNFFLDEHRVHGDTSGSDGSAVSREGMRNRNNTDGSLYSILTHCSELCSGTPYNIMSSAQQLVTPRNLGIVGSAVVRNSNILQQGASSLDYLGGREASSALMSSNLGWMNLPHQNSALHDSMGKSFLRSWNQ